MAIDINKVKARLSGLKTTTQKNNLVWKPTAGKQQVRIVPYKHDQENPFVELLFHYGINNKTYISPKSFHKPDPIVEFAEDLMKTGDKDDWKMGKKLEPKMRIYAPILVRGEEKEGVKFWAFGKKVYETLLGIIADPDYGDITDPKTGRDITIEFIPTEESGKDFPDTNILVKPKETPVSDDKDVLAKISNCKNIAESFQLKSYDELKQILKDWLEPDAAASATATSTPSDSIIEDEPKSEAQRSEAVEETKSEAAGVDDFEALFDK